MQYFAPDYELDVRSSNMENANSSEYLLKIRNSVIENLSRTKFAPSVQMQDVPPDPEGMDDEADAELDDLDEDESKDVRHTERRADKHIDRADEFDESGDEEDRASAVKRNRRGIMDYVNPYSADHDEDRDVDMDHSEMHAEAQSPGESQTANENANGAGKEKVLDNGDAEMEDANGAIPQDPLYPNQEKILPDEADAAKEEGRAERLGEDQKGEARTEAAS